MAEAVVLQPVLQLGQKFPGHVPVDQADLGGVAHAGPGTFGVFDDVQGHILIRVPVHVDVADAGPRLQHGDGGVVHAGPDEPRAPPGDEQVHQPSGLHQLICRGPSGILHQLERVMGQSGGGQTLLQRGHNGGGGAVSLLPSPQDAGRARLQGQGGGVGGDVGAALVNNGDHPHRHGGLFNDQPVGPLHPTEDRPHRVGQLRHLPQAGGHAGNSVGAEGQPVQHHLGDGPLGRLQVQGIGRKDVCAVGLQGVRHGQQGLVFRPGIRQGHPSLGGLCVL